MSVSANKSHQSIFAHTIFGGKSLAAALNNISEHLNNIGYVAERKLSEEKG